MAANTIALASAARTATTQSSDLQKRQGSNGIVILLDVTANAGQINSIQIQGKVGSSYVTIAEFTSLAITGTGQKAFLFGPGAASAASWTSTPLQGEVPDVFRIQVTHNAAESITYEVMVGGAWLATSTVPIY